MADKELFELIESTIDSIQNFNESLKSNIAYKNAKKEAVDAVIDSNARHKAINASRTTDSKEEFKKYKHIAKKLADSKVENLANLVQDADKTEDRVSIDIRDDDKFARNTNAVTADFEGKTHMSLHVIKGEHPLLDKERKGRQQSTGYGENPKFVKDITGKDLGELATKKFEAEKKKVGLLEDLVQRSDLTKEELFKMWEERYYALVCGSGDARNICINANASEYYSEFDDDKDYIPNIGPGQKHHEKAIRKYLRDIEKLKTECAESIAKKENVAICDYVLDALRELDNKGYIFDLRKRLSELKEDNLTESQKVPNRVKTILRKKKIDTRKEYGAAAANAAFKTFEKTKDIEDVDDIDNKLKVIVSTGVDPNTGKKVYVKKSKKSLKESEFSDDLTAIYGDNIYEIGRIKDVLNQVKDIKYGFISTKDGSRIDDREWIHHCDNLGDYYKVNDDPEITLKNKLGICQDQSKAIKYLFEKLHPEIDCELYALITGRYGHCVPCFRDDSKWYYLENSWDKERGLHGAFLSRQELEKYLSDLYHKHHDKDTNGADVTVIPYEKYLKSRDLNESVNYEEEVIFR